MVVLLSVREGLRRPAWRRPEVWRGQGSVVEDPAGAGHGESGAVGEGEHPLTGLGAFDAGDTYPLRAGRTRFTWRTSWPRRAWVTLGPGRALGPLRADDRVTGRARRPRLPLRPL